MSIIGVARSLWVSRAGCQITQNLLKNGYNFGCKIEQKILLNNDECGSFTTPYRSLHIDQTLFCGPEKIRDFYRNRKKYLKNLKSLPQDGKENVSLDYSALK